MEEKIKNEQKENKFHPKVSIIIPVYNGANYMREAINSALAQTYDNIEVIVVNDGSTDNTEEIAKSYGDKIRYFPKKNGGVSTALNLGIEKAEGEYISWLSHDDVYYANKVEAQVERLLKLSEKERLSTIIFSNYSLIDENSKEFHKQQFHSAHDIEKLDYPLYSVLNGLVHGCTLLLPKRCFEQVGYFDVHLKATQDYDLWFKMFPKYKILFLSDVLVKSRWHSDQGSKKIKTANEEGNDLWIKMIEGLSNSQKIIIGGGVVSFYRKTLKILRDADYERAANHIEKKISDFTNRDISAIMVSIIVPFHNRIIWTLQAVQSVLRQTHTNFELILVNDASSENIEAIEKAILQDRRIRLIANKRSRGASGARNTGIDNARGDYIAFLDSDDLFTPEKIEKQLEYMVRNGVDFSHTSYVLFSEKEGIEKRMRSGQKDYSYPEIIAGCGIATPTVMIFSDVLKVSNLRFPEQFAIGEDICLWIDCARITFCKGIDEFLSRVRKHDKNAAYDNTAQINGIKNVLDYSISHFLDRSTVPYIRSLNTSLVASLEKLYDCEGLKDKEVKGSPHEVSSAQLVTSHILGASAQKCNCSLKEKARFILRKIIWNVSPTFRMLVGNRERMKRLLEDVDQGRTDLSEKMNYLDNVISQRNAEVLGQLKSLGAGQGEVRELLEEKIESDIRRQVKKEMRREYLPNFVSHNINVLDEIVYVQSEHVSQTLRYECGIVEFFNKMKKFILKTDIVLDIGCGVRPQNFFVPKVHMCIEPFEQYRKVVKPFLPNDTHFVFLKGDAISSLRNLDDQSVDTVFMMDLIEHLEKEDGLELLKEADRVARKQIVVFTPLGFYPMHFREEGQKDAWGLDGNDVQEHKSGWLPKDFGKSWDFHICVDCHEAFLPEEKAQGKKYSALMAIKTKVFNGFPVIDGAPDFVKVEYEKRYIGDE